MSTELLNARIFSRSKILPGQCERSLRNKGTALLEDVNTDLQIPSSRCQLLSRDFKIQRRDGNENVKKSNRFNKQNNNFARASRFFLHFVAVFARLRRENA